MLSNRAAVREGDVAGRFECWRRSPRLDRCSRADSGRGLVGHSDQTPPTGRANRHNFTQSLARNAELVLVASVASS
jgi:hypothetical protein